MKKIISLFSSLLDQWLHTKPWLYTLLALSAIGLVILMIVSVFHINRQVTAPKKGPIDIALVESKEGRDQRATLMNVLNAFYLQETETSKSVSGEELKEEKLSSVKALVDKLSSIEAEGTIFEAQQDLISLMKQWQDYIIIDGNTDELHDDFLALGQEYPWLKTLLQIIIVNKL